MEASIHTIPSSRFGYRAAARYAASALATGRQPDTPRYFFSHRLCCLRQHTPPSELLAPPIRSPCTPQYICGPYASFLPAPCRTFHASPCLYIDPPLHLNSYIRYILHITYHQLHTIITAKPYIILHNTQANLYLNIKYKIHIIFRTHPNFTVFLHSFRWN